jgi:hypothetical protein
MLKPPGGSGGLSRLQAERQGRLHWQHASESGEVSSAIPWWVGPQSTYIECRAVSGVFRTIDPPPTPSPPSECVLPPHQRRGGTHSPGGERGGDGESIFRKMPDIGLASDSIIPLRAGRVGAKIRLEKLSKEKVLSLC